MKRATPSLITVVLSLLLALFSAALTYSTPSVATKSFSAGTLLMKGTATHQLEEQTEIGSTDEIVAMSGVISLIIVVPILMTRKLWR